MIISEVTHSRSSQFGHAGLALIGEMARICGIDDLGRKVSKAKQPQIQDAEILRTLCGLFCQGKTDFDHVKEYREDEFFRTALGISRTPSAEILRQRFQALSLHTDLMEHLPACSLRLWQKMGMKPEYIQHDDRSWVRMDIDTVIFDNADTQKEGAEFTYTNQFGFHPIFAHLGGGWMVNTELRPGSAHSCAPGTREFISQSLDHGRAMVEEPLLVVADSGFDSQELIADLDQADNTDFVIKHNLRRESKEAWLETAKAHCQEKLGLKENKTTYRGSIQREIAGMDSPIRLVFEVTETTSKKGQMLLTPDITVFVAWTSLDLAERDVLKIYRDRGTSEQYHAEFKSEMDMERLPSGKFRVNSAFLLLGMLVYNMLKVIGQDLVIAKAVGLKKATRRRMKTVMRSVMFMCGKITRHARKWKLHLGCPEPWFVFFKRLFYRLRAA